MNNPSLKSNEQLYDHCLPDIHEIAMQPLAAKYAAINLRLCMGSILVVLLVLIVGIFQPWFKWSEKLFDIFIFCSIVLLCLEIIFTLYRKLADPKKSYALREHDLSFQSGLIFRKKVTQPICRIQHIELKQGPIERKVGLATLQVFSAGGALHTFEIPGLALANAQKLRQFILQHKDAATHG